MMKEYLRSYEVENRKRLIIPLYILILIVCFPVIAHSQKVVTQSTKGNQSPTIVAGGDVFVNYKNYGITEKTFNKVLKEQEGNRKVIERLLKTIEEKDVALDDKDAKFDELSEKYKALEESLAKRSAEDNNAIEAKKRLEAGDLEGAARLLQQSLKKNLENLEEKRKAAAVDAYELGSLRDLQLDYSASNNYYKQALQLDPENRKYLFKMGAISIPLESNKAIEYFNKALSIDLKIHGEQHRNTFGDYNNLGIAWCSFGQPKKGIEYISKALEISLKLNGEKHIDTVTVYINLGIARAMLRDHNKALEYFTKARDIALGLDRQRDPSLSVAYFNIGSAWKDLGDQKTAIENYIKILDDDIKLLGERHTPEITYVYRDLGWAWGALGDHKKALVYYTKAYDTSKLIYGESDRRTLEMKEYLDSARRQAESIASPNSATGH
jgi:tetratricopeptide (TPR) repeat protein